MGFVPGKFCGAAVRLQDLLHHMQPQDMGGILPQFPVQRGQHRQRIPRAVVGQGDAQHFFLYTGFDPAVHRRLVVPHTVAQHIFQCTPQQSAVHTEGERLCAGVQVQFHHAVLRQRPVAEIRHEPAQQRPGLAGFPPQRLRAVLQLAGQVQVLHQGTDLLALVADALRFLARLRGHRAVGLDLFRPAQDQRKGRADVVADPRDPVGARFVPALDDLVAAAQLLTGLVQPPGQFPGKALGGQVHAAARQNIQAVGHCLQGAGAAPADQQAAHEDQHHHGDQHTAGVGKDPRDQVGVAVKVIAGDAALGHAQHQHAVVPDLAKDRVIVQVPAGKGRHLGDGVGAVQFRGQVVLPYHLARVVQHHGPGIALQPGFRRQFLKYKFPRRVAPQMVGDLGAGIAEPVLGDLAVIIADPDHRRDAQDHQQQDDGGCGQHIAPDHTGEGLHRVPSPASL